MFTLTELLDQLWVDYAQLNPQAGQIHALLAARGETIVNDHLALRTFGDPRCGLEVLAEPFVQRGYVPAQEYRFPEKKLRARHYLPPQPALPKLFVSQLDLELCSAGLRQTVAGLLDQVPPGAWTRDELCTLGRLWSVSGEEYAALQAESEYAAWLAAWGFRANHFTVLVNALTSVPSLAALNSLLQEHGIALNAAGGEIKGSPQDRLEQSSTLAPLVEVAFSDGLRSVPACYYEFARRYPLPDGSLFAGFLEKSADKIFESTDAARR
jgi:hypothetical protein